MSSTPRALSGVAFTTLLVIALMMGANHVAARFAFNSGVDVVTAISVRSLVTAFAVGLIVWQQRVPLALSLEHKRHLPAIGVLIAIQSFCLYSAVARLPVALALLAFNTYPLSTALWARVLYKQRPQREVLLAIPVILFGLALVLTENGTRGLDGRLRTLSTLSIVGVMAVAVALSGSGFQWPGAATGWWGLGALTFLYGTAFTVMFTVLPKLGVVGNSAIMNVEPVFALLLAWALLGQTIAVTQVIGACLVVLCVMWLGLRKGR